MDEQRKLEKRTNELALLKNEVALELENLEGENNKIDKLNEEIKNRIRKDEERLEIQRNELGSLEAEQRELTHFILEENEKISDIKEKNKSFGTNILDKKSASNLFYREIFSGF